MFEHLFEVIIGYYGEETDYAMHLVECLGAVNRDLLARVFVVLYRRAKLVDFVVNAAEIGCVLCPLLEISYN